MPSPNSGMLFPSLSGTRWLSAVRFIVPAGRAAPTLGLPPQGRESTTPQPTTAPAHRHPPTDGPDRRRLCRGRGTNCPLPPAGSAFLGGLSHVCPRQPCTAPRPAPRPAAAPRTPTPRPAPAPRTPGRPRRPPPSPAGVTPAEAVRRANAASCETEGGPVGAPHPGGRWGVRGRPARCQGASLGPLCQELLARGPAPACWSVCPARPPAAGHGLPLLWGGRSELFPWRCKTLF